MTEPMPASPVTPPSLIAARCIVETMVAEGLDEAVLCPGSRSAPLAYALAEAQEAGRLALRVVLDERSAGFIALGMARAHALEGRPRPAAVVTTSGTAVANLHPAIAEADAAGIPLIALTADRPHELVGTGANQTTEQTAIFGRAPRLVVDLPADLAADGLGAGPASIAGQVRRAMAAAMGSLGGDPGPAQVNARFRPPLAPPSSADAAACPGPAAAGSRQDAAGGQAPGGSSGHSGGAPVPAAAVAGRPLAAALPVRVPASVPAPAAAPMPRVPGGDPGGEGAGEGRGIVVAGDTPHPQVGQLARALAEQLDWPLLAEPTSQARAGERALTRYAELLGTPAGQDLVERATDVLVTGHPSLTRPITALLGRADKRIRVLSERPTWTDTAGAACAVVPIDARQGAGQAPGIIEALGLEGAPASWARSWHRAASDLPGAGVEQGSADAAVDAVWEAALEGDHLLVLGSSMTIRRLDRLARPAGRPPMALANRGLAGIDGTIATALGAGLASGRPVRAVVGDLTFLHDAMSLLRGAAEAQADLQVVVIDDAGGAIFSGLEYAAVPGAGRFERLFSTPQSADIPALAAALGARALVPSDLQELRSLLRESVTGTSVIVWKADDAVDTA
ncbi:2-succinyl-5-enolpyruvyl-6-hydroxy-3-cyclohexene-1-carboxylate synthase [Actinomyces slackii]|nr:thiamine pyrophosphate-binding protein [Actinomyces slackii]